MRLHLKVSAAGLALLALTACEGFDLSGGGGGGPTPSSTTNTLGTGGAGYSGTNSQMGTGWIERHQRPRHRPLVRLRHRPQPVRPDRQRRRRRVGFADPRATLTD